MVCSAFFYYLQLYNWFADDNIFTLKCNSNLEVSAVSRLEKCYPTRNCRDGDQV